MGARWRSMRALWRFGLVAVPVCAFGAVGAGFVVSTLPWLDGQRSLLWTMLALSASTVAVRVVAMTLVLGILRAGGDRLGVLMVELGGTVAVGLPLVTLAALRWGFELPQVLALLLAVEAGKMGALWWRMQRGVWRRSLLPQASERATPVLCAGEAATLVMLATVGILAGAPWQLPLPWWGPVLAPVSIAVLLIVWGTHVTQSTERPRATSLTVVLWSLNGIGIALAHYVFMAGAIHALPQGLESTSKVLPTYFNWPLFSVALVLMAAPAVDMGWPWRSSPGVTAAAIRSERTDVQARG